MWCDNSKFNKMDDNKVDEITRLAMNIYSNKGVYALLLGSGISLSAGILSGWKVTEDLLKKLAFMQEGHYPDDVFQWYQDKYQKEAEYSDLLSQLGHHPAEIGNLLWSYFEQSEEEKKNKQKEPTKAHKAIAELASNGYFKVIITTNFDRLLESALDQKGVKYQVVSNETNLDGAVPIVHFPLTIFKVNGDYKDTRVRNTEEELTNYPLVWDNYMLDILKDFGLVTCGWSATWDKAVINDILKNKDHQYSYNFTYVDKDKSKEIFALSDACNGDTFGIDGADDFFTELAERIKALEVIHDKDMEIDKEIAIARVKDYIMRDEDIIRYTDLFENETARVIQKASEFTYTNEYMNAALYNQIYSTAISNLSVLLPMSIVAARWADSNHAEAIVNSLAAIANRRIIINGVFTDEGKLQNHAIDTMYLYGTGIACLYYRKYELLDRLFRVKLDDADRLSSSYLIDIANCWLIDRDRWNGTSQNRLKTPFSWLVSDLMRPMFTVIKDKEEFDTYFCIFEKLLAMYFYLLISSTMQIEEFRHQAPIGQFAWQSFYFTRKKDNKYDAFFNEIADLKEQSSQLRGGLFEGKFELFSEAFAEVNAIEKKALPYMM